MTFDLPTWCKQRQVKTEEVAPAAYRVTGPNLPEAVVEARIADELTWQAVLKAKPDGPDLEASSATYDNPRDALMAAFELYRTRYVV